MQQTQPNPTQTSMFAFDNSYARLPDRFYAKLAPTAVASPRLIKLNEKLARELGLDPDQLSSHEGVEALSGNSTPRGAEPLAMAYAGHQFGNWVPQLGDGRAILLGEIRDVNGARRDLQLKGSGPTPFSRNGDGRAALGPVLREYIVSEAMAALGIPTTRSLAVVMTGERVLRQDGLLPGAVLTRVAQSHVRVGTFEYFANRRDADAVRTLADYVIDRLYPKIDAPNRYRAFLDEVIARTAGLVASWQLVGFIHGVMNTDNTSVSGETIDYGPCAFMDTFNPSQVYSSIDSAGRYAYGNQPRIAHWNLVRLAQALLPLLGEDENSALDSAREAINAYPPRFESELFAGLLRKIGIYEAREGDVALAGDLLERMAVNKVDFTLLFRLLCDAGVEMGQQADAHARNLFENPISFDEWAKVWRRRLALEEVDPTERSARMRRSNPAFIPRNHRIEAVIAAAHRNDFVPLDNLLTVLASPYSDNPEFADYAQPPKPDEVVHQTFCGT